MAKFSYSFWYTCYIFHDENNKSILYYNRMNPSFSEVIPLGNEPVDPSMNAINWYNDKIHDRSIEIIYNYSKLEVNPKQQISKTLASDGFVRILFQADPKQSTPHLFFSQSPMQVHRYYVGAINIFISPEPKIVIENKPLTNGVPIYIHIPLITRTDGSKLHDRTSIDKLLNVTDKEEIITVDINSLLGQTQAAYYQGQSILKTKKSIAIYTSLDKDDILYENAVTPSNWNGITIEPTRLHTVVDLLVFGKDDKVANVIEGLDGDGVDMDGDVYDCTPLDIEADNIAFMQVPFFSQNVSNKVSMNFLQGMIFLFYLGIIVIICAFVIPNIYAINFSTLTINIQSQILFLEAMIPLLFLIGGTGLILDGALVRESIQLINAGVLIILFFGCFWVAIQALKMYDPSRFKKSNDASMLSGFSPVVFNSLYAFWFFMFIFFFIIGYVAIYMNEGRYPMMIIFWGTCFSAGLSFIYYAIFMLYKNMMEI